MKIYTKTGDEGMTGLWGGARVAKNSQRVSAYGDVDELNAILGVVISETSQEPIQKALKEVQVSLFIAGAQLAAPSGEIGMQVITSSHVDALERQIDAITETLTPQKNFILPGGSKTSAYLHLARTVCRRAERATVELSRLPEEEVDRWVLMYLNRLSDYLFVFARLANQLENVADIPWIGRKTAKES